jgi:SHS2 domain-containing protein
MELSYIPSMKGVALGDHTADIWLEVEGGSLEECIRRAVHGLYSVMAQEFSISKGEMAYEIFDVGAREMLLVDVLSEALFLFDSESCLILDPELKTEKGKYVLSFTKSECSVPPGKGGMEVKAVTFHDAELSVKEGVWKGRVLLDI